jgi:hypothetical protein
LGRRSNSSTVGGGGGAAPSIHALDWAVPGRSFSHSTSAALNLYDCPMTDRTCPVFWSRTYTPSFSAAGAPAKLQPYPRIQKTTNCHWGVVCIPSPMSVCHHTRKGKVRREGGQWALFMKGRSWSKPSSNSEPLALKIMAQFVKFLKIFY